MQPHPRNVRLHDEDNLKVIEQSLLEFGQRKPLVVWNNYVIAGCGTLEAVKRLQWATVSICRCDHLTEEKAKAYAIVDNKATDMSEFNYEMLAEEMTELKEKGINLALTGFQDFETEPLLNAEWKPQEVTDPKDGKVPINLTSGEADCIRPAIEWARQNLPEFDTESDGAALAAFCHHALSRSLI